MRHVFLNLLTSQTHNLTTLSLGSIIIGFLTLSNLALIVGIVAGLVSIVCTILNTIKNNKD